MMFYGIILAFFSPIFGQFLRFGLVGSAFLFLDIFLPILLGIWIFIRFKEEKWAFFENIKNNTLFAPISIFLAFSLSSLCFAGAFLSFHEFLESGFYFFRIFYLFFFVFLVSDIIRTKKEKIFVLKTFFLSGIVLFVLGLFQLVFFPDFSFMQKYGWDPHIGRMLSTWFDPNFLGGFFAFLISLLCGLFIYETEKKQKILYGILFALFFVGLLLTFSRSGFLAFAISMSFLGIFFFRKIFFIGVFAFLFFLPFVPRAQERLLDGVHSAISLFEETPLFLPDPTSRLRVQNFQEGISLIKNHFWIGVGFNTLRLQRSQQIHSSGGFDSSFLTVFATTGIFGFLAYCSIWMKFLYQGFQIFQNIKNLPLERGIALGFFSGLLGLLVHSFFVNSLFYVLMMIGILGVGGLLMRRGSEGSNF